MATKTVGRLKIQLDAVTNRFDKGMNKAGKKITRFQRVAAGAKRFIGGLTKIIAGFGLALVGVGVAIGRMVGDSLERLDTLAKTSSMLGIASEKLSGLQMAAQLTGVEVTAMGDGLQKMQKNIAEAARGTGEAVESFELLGISAEDLINMSPEEQFYAIADAMEGVGTQADKMEIAMGIFGRGGGGLLNTLALGSEELRNMQTETEELGISFSNIDLKKVEDANDAILKAKTAIQGVIDKLAVALSPTIAAASDMFVEWAKSGTIGSEQIEKSIEGIIDKLGTVKTVMDGISVVWNGVIGVGAGATGMAASISALPGMAFASMTGQGVGQTTAAQGGFALGAFDVADKRIEKVTAAVDRLLGSKTLGGVSKGGSSLLDDLRERTKAKKAETDANAQKIMAQRDAEKARSEAAIGATATPAGVARGGSRIGGTGADGIWRGDPQTERSANLLQHIVDNGIPLAVGSTP